jgi:hypothetical protein
LWEETVCGRGLLVADEQGETSAGTNQAGSNWEDGVEALDGAKGDDVGGCERKIFCAASEDLASVQLQRANDFAEKGSLLVIRFDQGQADRGRPYLDGETREAGAGADVHDKLSTRNGSG